MIVRSLLFISLLILINCSTSTKKDPPGLKKENRKAKDKALTETELDQDMSPVLSDSIAVKLTLIDSNNYAVVIEVEIKNMTKYKFYLNAENPINLSKQVSFTKQGPWKEEEPLAADDETSIFIQEVLPNELITVKPTQPKDIPKIKGLVYHWLDSTSKKCKYTITDLEEEIVSDIILLEPFATYKLHIAQSATKSVSKEEPVYYRFIWQYNTLSTRNSFSLLKDCQIKYPDRLGTYVYIKEPLRPKPLFYSP